MPDISKKNPSESPVTVVGWLFSYLLPGIGLVLLGLVTAAMAPADVIGLGGFLCFFTLGIVLCVEGTKKWLSARGKSRQTDKK